MRTRTITRYGQVVSIAVLAALLGCAPLADRRLARIEAQQREHETRLARLKQEIADAEVAARLAREEAEFEQCRAGIATIEAEMAARVGACFAENASYQACRAKGEKKKGDNTLVGCGLGIAAALLTGGGAAGWAIAGCGGGRVYGEMTEAHCEQPPPCLQGSFLLAEVTRDLDLAGLPLCGTSVSLDLVTGQTVGLHVDVVVAGMGAEAAGVRPGDVILGVDDHFLSTWGELRRAMATPSDDSGSVLVHLVRHGVYGIVRVLVTMSEGRPMLGVETTERVAVGYAAIQVVAVGAPSGVVQPDLREGDVIVAVDGSPPTQPLDVSKWYAAGAVTSFDVLRGGDVVSVTDPAFMSESVE